MVTMLSTIAPMFVVILAGFAAGFIGRFRRATSHLNAFLFYFALPAFIYTAMVTAPPLEGFPLAALVIPLVITPALSVGLYYLCRVLGEQARRGAAPASLAGTFGNVGYFGIPISISVIGPEAGLAAGVIHMIHNAFYMNGYPLVRTAANTRNCSAEQPRGFRSVARRQLWPVMRRAILFNPVFSAMLLALILVLTDRRMPSLVDEPAEMLGDTAVPLALFCVGLALHPAIEGIRSGGVPIAPIAVGTAVKLLILPLLTWAAVLVFYGQLGPVWAGTLIILAATPSSTTVFLFSEEYDGDGRLAAAILVTSTGLSLITLPLIAEFMRI